jgi:putative ABC transport system ATP-binding protein
MGTLDRPIIGTVRVTDRELSALRASRIGFLFQRSLLAEYQNVLDNVADGLLCAGVPRARRRQLAADVLARAGAGPSGRRPAGSAVGVGRAVVTGAG